MNRHYCHNKRGQIQDSNYAQAKYFKTTNQDSNQDSDFDRLDDAKTECNIIKITDSTVVTNGYKLKSI